MRRLACLLVLVACGDDSSRHILDAPLQQSDTPLTIDAPIQPVTVTFTRDGAPVADTRVYFQNADSSVAGMPMTDATGTASAVVGVGGSVTVVDITTPASGGQNVQLTTWVDVKSGDHLLLADTTTAPTYMDVLIAPDPAAINIASSYSIFSSCSPNPSDNPDTVFTTVGSGSGVATSLTFTSVGFRCATADLLVVANDTNGEPFSYFFAPNQTVSAAQLDLSAQTYVEALTTHDYHITGFTGVSLKVVDQQASPHGLVYGHDRFLGPGDPLDATLDLPAITGGQRFIEIDDSTTALTRRHYFEWGGTLDPYMTDYSTHLLPAFTETPVLDPTTHIISWNQSGGGLQTDFTRADFYINGPTSTWYWNVIGPGPSATIQLPTVPTDLADYNYGGTESMSFYSLVTGKVPGGYDAARAVMFATTGPNDLVKGASGSVVVNELFQGKAVNAKTIPSWTRPRAQPPTFLGRLLHRYVR